MSCCASWASDRSGRRHSHLYDIDYVNTLSEDFKKSFVVAMKYFSNHGTKIKMDYVDFSLLDVGTNSIDEKEICNMYVYYREIYNNLR